ncbi:MAG: hypothetical protein VR71_02025 [Roseovarius sp. BRH_c41]|uniref:hypothetical protein n=1 Tax=Roseovarius sp. BRH_c41 TaxID=1629709 RepID=UPI0005F21591|nr:hypothetical protein [Roseovarius sp. BRH_c41]KJS45215.1 MAG: hypothetical protein VR71_02025 [Roseovarius sp. BRH_c41]
MSRPTETQVAEAIALLSDPARFGTAPGARGLAWATLKQARGQSYNYTRLPMVRHFNGCAMTLTARLGTTEPDRLRRIHDRAAQHGYDNGGDAA